MVQSADLERLGNKEGPREDAQISLSRGNKRDLGGQWAGGARNMGNQVAR